VSSNTKLIPPKPGDGPEVHKAFWDGVVFFIMCELMNKRMHPELQGFLDVINAKLENYGVRIEICADSSRLIVVATEDQEVSK
jgi:hypothetical protein